MRLFSLAGATAVDSPEGHFEPDKDGGYLLPDTLFDRLHSSAVRGVKQWEDEIERQVRLNQADLDRRRSPEALNEAVMTLVELAKQASGSARADDGEPAAKGTSRRTRAKDAGDPAE